MLGDNPERSKNPLKKAMRRRNAKQVQFTAPIYFEASDVEYSTEEEDEGEGEYFQQGEEGADTQNQEQEVVADEGATVEPLNLRAPSDDTQTAIDPRVDAPGPDSSMDKSQTIDDDLDRIGNAPAVEKLTVLLTNVSDNDASTKSRKGTVRNTDSFFKDDGVETRKINLTPSLLRDDSSNSTIRPVDTREVCTLLQCGGHTGSLMLASPLRRDQASIHSRRSHLPQEKAKTIRGAKRRKECLVVFSSERREKGAVKKMTLMKGRRHPRN